ncbi:MAG: RNA-binding S4 domain-containing protein [Synechococcaceae cyanobacterium]|nr:RNA-binding S4 domain-containing protein [Synechococcaceae cyanobacterium]
MKLDQFLKWSGAVATGGEAKLRIQAGDVRVQGQVETRRGRRLSGGERVLIDGHELVVPTLPGEGGAESLGGGPIAP